MSLTKFASPTEQLITNRLIDSILAKGHSISVDNGNKWTVKRSRDKATILEALATTDSDTLVIRKASGDKFGTICLVWGNETDLVSDWSWPGSKPNQMDDLLTPILDYSDTLRDTLLTSR